MEGKRRGTAAGRVSLVLAVTLLASFMVFASAPEALSSPGWSAPVNLSPDPLTENQSIHMAVDASGRTHVVWAALDEGGVFRVWYSRNTGSGWTAPESLSPDPLTDNFKAWIVLDAAGNPHVVWGGTLAGDEHVWYSEKNGGAWTAPENLSPDGTFMQFPQMVVDADGNIHVVWEGDGAADPVSRIWYTKRTGSAWSAPESISPDSTSNQLPQLAVDADGYPHVTWTGRVSSVVHVLYSEWDGSAWTAPENLSLGTSTDNWIARMALDTDGNPHVAWKGLSGVNQDIFYCKNTGGAWSAPENISPGSTEDTSPCMALGADGAPHVAWTGYSGTPPAYHIWYSAFTGSAWTTPEKISSDSTDNWASGLEVDQGGSLHVVWTGDDATTSRVWYSSNTGSGWSAPRNISPDPITNCGEAQLALDGSGSPHVIWEGQDAGYTYRVWYASDITYSFYFAEGYTGAGFQEYLCLGNPGSTDVAVDVTYLFTDGTSLERTYAVPAMSRFTADVNAEVGADREVSIKCNAGAPFVAERPMYFEYTGGGGSWTGGHDAVGASYPSRDWYFAEGYTGPGFDEWICVLNPGDDPARLKFHFQTEEAGPIEPEGDYTVPAHSRATFKANDLLGGTAYQTSLKLTSDVPVVAERPMYFDYQGTGGWGWTGGHCVMGVPTLANDFFFAEGTTRGGFEEWLTMQNPGDTAISVEAVYQLGSGGPITNVYDIPAGTRATVYVPNEAGTEQDVSVHLSSESAFLAERPMYFDYQGTGSWGWTGGHCVIGATSPADTWFFAEGYTGDGFEEWLCIQNPGATAASVEITYYPEGGTPMVKDAITVAANSRYTVNVNADAGAGLSLCAGLTSDQPVIVERPMYFNFRGTWTGGHDVVGYTP